MGGLSDLAPGGEKMTVETNERRMKGELSPHHAPEGRIRALIGYPPYKSEAKARGSMSAPLPALLPHQRRCVNRRSACCRSHLPVSRSHQVETSMP